MRIQNPNEVVGKTIRVVIDHNIVIEDIVISVDSKIPNKVCLNLTTGQLLFEEIK